MSGLLLAWLLVSLIASPLIGYFLKGNNMQPFEVRNGRDQRHKAHIQRLETDIERLELELREKQREINMLNYNYGVLIDDYQNALDRQRQQLVEQGA